MTIETVAYGAITAAHERVLRARLSPHRQDCVDFGRAIARSSPAAEKEELLRAVGAVTPLARPSRWQRWSVRRCARARALLNGVMCSQARTRELVVGASHRERALLSEANLLLFLDPTPSGRAPRTSPSLRRAGARPMRAARRTTRAIEAYGGVSLAHRRSHAARAVCVRRGGCVPSEEFRSHIGTRTIRV